MKMFCRTEDNSDGSLPSIKTACSVLSAWAGDTECLIVKLVDEWRSGWVEEWMSGGVEEWKNWRAITKAL